MRTTDNGKRLSSKDYPNKEERLAVFNKLVGTHTSIKDVEFDLFNVRGFRNVPSHAGSPSFHYRYTVRRDTADVKKWTEFLPPHRYDSAFTWQDSLVSHCKEKWTHHSSPSYFGLGPNQLVTAYKPEGIVFWDIKNK